MFDNTIVREFANKLLDSVDEGTIRQKDAYKVFADAFSYMSKEADVKDLSKVEEPIEMKELLKSTILDFYRNYLDLSSDDDITIQIHKYIEGK